MVIIITEHASACPNSQAFELVGSAKHADSVKSAEFLITSKVAHWPVKIATSFIMLSAYVQLWPPFRNTVGSVVVVVCVQIVVLAHPALVPHLDGITIIQSATPAISSAIKAIHAQFVARLIAPPLTGKWLNALYVRSLCIAPVMLKPT